MVVWFLGVVLNMRGVALRCMGDLRRAAESYQAAIDICEEFEDRHNWAVALANLGEEYFIAHILCITYCNIITCASHYIKAMVRQRRQLGRIG